MSQMKQVNVICLPHAGYMVKQLSQPLSPMQIRKSTRCVFFDCSQLTHIRESFYFHITLQSSLCNFTQHWFLYKTLNSEVLKKKLLHNAKVKKG